MIKFWPVETKFYNFKISVTADEDKSENKSVTKYMITN